MPPALTPSTELEAVNTMLRHIDEQPVNSIPASGSDVAVLAEQVLHEESRQVQSEGFSFNTETVELTPTTGNEIIVPDNYLHLDPQDSRKEFVQRGKKLYDKEDNTFTITDKVRVRIILFLPFNDIPEAFRRYITIRAARVFVKQITGEEPTVVLTEQDESNAKTSAMQKETRTGDYSFIAHPDIRNIHERTLGRSLARNNL